MSADLSDVWPAHSSSTIAHLRQSRSLLSGRAVGSAAPHEVRRAWWAFAGRQWRLLACMIGAAAALTAALSLLVSEPLVRGVIIGAAIVGTTAAVAGLMVQATGTTTLTPGPHMRQWGTTELRLLRHDDARPPSPSVLRLYWYAVAIVTAGTTAVLLNVESAAVSHSWTVWSIVSVMQAALGLLAYARRGLRPVAVGWLAGVTGIAIAVAVLAAGR